MDSCATIGPMFSVPILPSLPCPCPHQVVSSAHGRLPLDGESHEPRGVLELPRRQDGRAHLLGARGRLRPGRRQRHLHREAGESAVAAEGHL